MSNATPQVRVQRYTPGQERCVAFTVRAHLPARPAAYTSSPTSRVTHRRCVCECAARPGVCILRWSVLYAFCWRFGVGDRVRHGLKARVRRRSTNDERLTLHKHKHERERERERKEKRRPVRQVCVQVRCARTRCSCACLWRIRVAVWASADCLVRVERYTSESEQQQNESPTSSVYRAPSQRCHAQTARLCVCRWSGFVYTRWSMWC